MHRSALAAAFLVVGFLLPGCTDRGAPAGDLSKAFSPIETGYRWSSDPAPGETVILEVQATSSMHAERFELLVEAEGMELPEGCRWVGTIYEGKIASIRPTLTIPDTGPVKIWVKATLHGEDGAQLVETGTVYEWAGPEAAKKAEPDAGTPSTNEQGEPVLEHPMKRRN